MMIIRTNAPIDQPAYMIDRDGNAIEIDHNGAYKCSIKNEKTDAVPVLTFATGGGSGLGGIEVISHTVENETEVRDMFVFTAEQAMVADIPPGAYYADILRTDDPGWEFGFDVIVETGVTAP